MWLGLVATCPLACMSSKYTPPLWSYSAPSVNTYPVASFVGVVPGGRIWADAEAAPNARNANRPARQGPSATRRMSVSPHVPPAGSSINSHVPSCQHSRRFPHRASGFLPLFSSSAQKDKLHPLATADHAWSRNIATLLQVRD